MLFKKLLVIALSAILVTPLAGQQAVFQTQDYGPVARMARLARAQAPQQPGQVAPAAAEPANPLAPEESQKPKKPGPPLTVEVIEGDGATNDIGTGVAVAPRVMVTDEAGNPVAGAEVVFALPMAGPSAIFSGWVRSQTLRTDESGIAAASGYAPNDTAGQFNIKVTATKGASKGVAIFSQTNIASAKKKSNKKWIILGAVAAGAAIAIAVAVASGDDTPPPGQANPVVITPGPITVGGTN